MRWQFNDDPKKTLINGDSASLSGLIGEAELSGRNERSILWWKHSIGCCQHPGKLSLTTLHNTRLGYPTEKRA